MTPQQEAQYIKDIEDRNREEIVDYVKKIDDRLTEIETLLKDILIDRMNGN
jgi:hypothetical protein